MKFDYQEMKFCVYLTIYAGNKLPPFYIGSSNINNICAGYCGSVKSRRYGNMWKCELANNRKLFKTKIISVHLTREEAFLKEEKLHRQLKVITNTMYINMTYANRRFCTIDGHSPETCAKISAANTGNKMPPRGLEYREKQRVAHLGKKASPETRLKKSIATKGMKISKDYLIEKHKIFRKVSSTSSTSSTGTPRKINDINIITQIHEMWVNGITRSEIKEKLNLSVSLSTISNMVSRYRLSIGWTQ